MIKKVGILTSSVIAGIALVGATFAAWAVTDNASELGIKISPSQISEQSAAYSTMVLEWGDTTQFQNISNLKRGESTDVYLEVKSTVTQAAGTSDTQRGGNLSLALTDLTQGDNRTLKLIDNITVRVYKTRTGAGTEQSPYSYSNEVTGLALGAATQTGYVTESSADIETAAAGTAQGLYFVVAIKDAVTTVEYNQIVEDIVYLTVDWNKPSNVTPVTTQRVYYKADGYVPNVYLFKNGSDPLVQNAAWPGPQMTVYDPAEEIYYYEFEQNKFDYVIFSNNGNNQTANLALNANPYWDGDSWETVPAITSYNYYLVGDMNNWTVSDTYKLTTVNGVLTTQFTIPANTSYTLKVFNGVNTYYGEFSHEDGPQTNMTWGNTTNAQQTIKVQFYPAKSGNVYIVLSPVTQ